MTDNASTALEEGAAFRTRPVQKASGRVCVACCNSGAFRGQGYADAAAALSGTPPHPAPVPVADLKIRCAVLTLCLAVEVVCFFSPELLLMPGVIGARNWRFAGG
jgi:hypothetical protein